MQAGPSLWLPWNYAPSEEPAEPDRLALARRGVVRLPPACRKYTGFLLTLYPGSGMYCRVTDDLNPWAGRPKHEALWPADLFTQGIGWVLIARFKSGGARVDVGIFLIDVLCLGAKVAFYEDCDASDYRSRIREHYESRFPMVAAQPTCARKLVEQAVQYAGALGFAPHPDYKKAARVFGGLRAEQCTQQFTFGREGKPFYRRGPRETEEHARRIVEHLDRRCGPGNYDYLILLGEAADIDRLFAD